jgi:hypothetical protein
MKKIIGALIALYSAFALSATTVPVQLLNPAGSTAGQTIISTGATTAPGWSTVPLSGLSSIAANTVLANATGSAIAPTAFAMPSCSAGGSALNWTSGSGFTCATGYAQLASPTFTGTVTVAALAASGAITPSQTAGIVGTTANNSANAGSVGEYMQGVTLTQSASNGVPMNGASVTLTPGDWEVDGICQSNPSGTTTTSQVVAGINTTSATFGTNAGINNYALIQGLSVPAGSPESIVAPRTRISISGSTTVFLVCQTSFSSGTLTISGLVRARRPR